MLTIEALNAYGADTHSGIARCLNDEAFYLGLIEMLINDDKFNMMSQAIRQRDIASALHLAYVLGDTATNLALLPLAEQIEKMILCLQIPGDSAVLDKQLGQVMHWHDMLRTIDSD